jgi:hypothetical protein
MCRDQQFLRLCRLTQTTVKQQQAMGAVSENQCWPKEIYLLALRMTGSKTRELLQHYRIFLNSEDPVSTETVWRKLHKPRTHGRAVLHLLLQVMPRRANDSVTIVTPGRQTTANAWCAVILRSVPCIRKSSRLESTHCGVLGSNSETRHREGSMKALAVISWYYVRHIATLHGRITVRQ